MFIGRKLRIYLFLLTLAKAREKLKWADGKAIKSEIDMQVQLGKRLN